MSRPNVYERSDKGVRTPEARSADPRQHSRIRSDLDTDAAAFNIRDLASGGLPYVFLDATCRKTSAGDEYGEVAQVVSQAVVITPPAPSYEVIRSRTFIAP